MRSFADIIELEVSPYYSGALRRTSCEYEVLSRAFGRLGSEMATGPLRKDLGVSIKGVAIALSRTYLILDQDTFLKN